MLGRDSYAGTAGRSYGGGQALTEFALVLPFLIVIFIGVLDLGRAYHTHVAVSNAARVGIIYAQQLVAPNSTGCLSGATATPPTATPVAAASVTTTAPAPTTWCFITVGDIIGKVKGEAQGGIDPAQMQVQVCLQNVSSCPVTNTSQIVSSNQAITVSVSVPFTTITPLVHLRSVGGAVSGTTFPFNAVAAVSTAGLSPTATNTPLPSATATMTPSPTATTTNTPSPTTTTGTPSPTATASTTSTPSPTATAIQGPTISGLSTTMSPNNKTATFAWTTNQTSAVNWVWVVTASGPISYTAMAGTSGSLALTSEGSTHASNYLAPGTYNFYVESAITSTGTMYATYFPSACTPPTCPPTTSSQTFTLRP